MAASDRSETLRQPSWPIRAVALTLLFFLAVPNLVVTWMSFGADSVLVFPPRGFSLHLYEEFFSSSDWMRTALLSLKVGAAATLIALVLGSAAAYGLVRATFRGKGILTVAILSPMFVPGIVTALSLYLYFAVIGLQGSELGLILAHTVLVVPYVMVVMMAALRAVDPTLELAARSMGAGQLTVFWRVTLPLVRNGLVSAAVFGFLISFDELVIALFLADIDTRTLPVKMYESIKFEISPVLAATSTLLTIGAFLVSLVAVTGRSAARWR